MEKRALPSILLCYPVQEVLSANEWHCPKVINLQFEYCIHLFPVFHIPSSNTEIHRLDRSSEIPFPDFKVEEYNDLSEENRKFLRRKVKYKFLEFAKADTKGKTKKLLYDGYKLYKEFSGIENDFRLMKDELYYDSENEKETELNNILVYKPT